MALPSFKVKLINHATSQTTEVVIQAGNAAAAWQMAKAMYPALTPQSVTKA